MTRLPKRRSQWAWWLLAIAWLLAWLLAWQYWPQVPAGGQAPPISGSPAPDGPTTASKFPDATTRESPSNPAWPSFLPAEARDTIALIQRGGPFPHRQDGSVFGNREGHLPDKPRGWYREYTVETPGLSHRGTRRIITGGNPPQTWYYTSDHYDSFRAFNPGTASGVSP